MRRTPPKRLPQKSIHVRNLCESTEPIITERTNHATTVKTVKKLTIDEIEDSLPVWFFIVVLLWLLSHNILKIF